MSEQYSQRNNIELAGIPNSFKDNVLEETNNQYLNRLIDKDFTLLIMWNIFGIKIDESLNWKHIY